MTDQFEDIVKVPKDRIAVVIGEKGKTRREIEKLTETKLSIDSTTGEAIIKRDTSSDQLKSLKAKDIVTAIASGFAPRKAYKLLNDNIYISTIDLEECVRESDLKRVKSRIIGSEGKSRSYISKLTSTEISIYGNVVSVIGESQRVSLASDAIRRLIDGSPHKFVFRFIQRKKKELE